MKVKETKETGCGQRNKGKPRQRILPAMIGIVSRWKWFLPFVLVLRLRISHTPPPPPALTPYWLTHIFFFFTFSSSRFHPSNHRHSLLQFEIKKKFFFYFLLLILIFFIFDNKRRLISRIILKITFSIAFIYLSNLHSIFHFFFLRSRD